MIWLTTNWVKIWIPPKFEAARIYPSPKLDGRAIMLPMLQPWKFVQASGLTPQYRWSLAVNSNATDANSPRQAALTRLLRY